MGQVVQGSSTAGYTVAVRQYESIDSEAYIPAAQDMLDDLRDDFERLQRVVNARTYKLESKLAEDVR
ncbi:hypothetical protein DC852_24525 [Vibrio parahaemolyticus]|nr:hypothetical protein [Vibrio parahaemolyticus]EKO3471107.1 hypothetical protein [Vibrio fluvialis]EGQ8939592.1 hypothetical protein [Vibrio parahaemolyticus]EGQ8949196.1 hypothetical protein [Vibrio parahaemolyticus]EGQ8969779.1 hypothetical protein [Vibrio parahaemolyticus]